MSQTICQESVIAGVDEAGRGPLAGPVVAAAVILSPSCSIDGIMDSKKLSPAKRARLSARIQQQALAVSVASASVEEIDELNILWASMLAMRRAVEQLSVRPAVVWVDGNRIPSGLEIPCQAIVQGDSKVAAISAASIIAKVTRDSLLLEYESIYPGYGFSQHKGYPTKAHYVALEKLGPTPIHRKSFRLN